MKHFLIVSLLAVSQLTVAQSASQPVLQTLDSAIARAQEVSFYSNTVDWDELSRNMHSIAKDATTIDDLKPAFELMLNSLRDHHATIRKTADYSVLAAFTDHQNSRKTDDRTYDPEVWKIVNNTEARFEYDILPNNIGYLRIVGIGPNVDGQKEAERIRNAVNELRDSKVSQWISTCATTVAETST